MTEIGGKLKFVWRVILVVLVCQAVGVIIGIASRYHYVPDISAGIGWGLATPVGFFLGTVWH
ncbi:unnamed protein product, partial [marine sediment metagenome]